MDELVIGEKRYVSSKKAAKLTGYAKDYVGQLCREGKVEARLVGRNWYVLEESILEHRFGAPKEENTDKNIVEAQKSGDTSQPGTQHQWESPKYTSEPSEVLVFPERVEREEQRVSEKPYETQTETVSAPRSEVKTSSVNDMQKAWQEWFSMRGKLEEEEERALPDGSDMLLEQGIESSKNVEKYSDIGSYEAQNVPEFYHEEPSPSIAIHRVHQVEREPREEPRERLEDVPVSVRRTVLMPEQERIPVRSSYKNVAPREASRPSFEAQKPLYGSQNTYVRPRSRRRKPFSLLKVTIFVILGLIVAGTYLSVSSISRNEAGSGTPILDFLTGVHTVTK